MKTLSQSFLRKALNQTFASNRKLGVLLVLTVLAGAATSVWPSLVLKGIVDGPLTTGEGSLWAMASIYLAAVLLIGVIDLAREYGATVFGQRMLLQIRKLMLDRLRILVDTSADGGRPAVEVGTTDLWQELGVNLRASHPVVCFDPRGLSVPSAVCPGAAVTVWIERGGTQDSVVVSSTGMVFP